MNLSELATQIAYDEGNKSQVKIGNIREIIAILSDLIASSNGAAIVQALESNGIRRRNRSSKKKSVKEKKQRAQKH